eukprot:2432537-Pleurochrysis_carterae.AAC.1
MLSLPKYQTQVPVVFRSRNARLPHARDHHRVVEANVAHDPLIRKDKRRPRHGRGAIRGNGDKCARDDDVDDERKGTDDDDTGDGEDQHADDICDAAAVHARACLREGARHTLRYKPRMYSVLIK